MTITYNGNSQTLSSYAAWNVLNTPIDGETSGTSFTVTFACLDIGDIINSSSSYGYTIGMRFKGYLAGSVGQSVTVTVPTDDMTATDAAGSPLSVTD